jgi:hypothetical protein
MKFLVPERLREQSASGTRSRDKEVRLLAVYARGTGERSERHNKLQRKRSADSGKEGSMIKLISHLPAWDKAKMVGVVLFLGLFIDYVATVFLQSIFWR